MATATPAQQSAIVDLYVALFNRAPDATGFEFWTQALANGASLPTITGSFFTSPETTAIYPVSQTAEQFVSAFYQTVFGRAPDQSGLQFWTQMLNAAGGPGSDAARALLVSSIVDIVSKPLDAKPEGLTDAQYQETVQDRTLFSKKNVAALDFAVNVKSDDVSLAKQALVDVVTPPTPTPGPAGETFTLTAGVDQKTTGAGADTFIANRTSVEVDDGKGGTWNREVESLNNGDFLDGGAGKDTLVAELFSCSTVTPTLRNIEVISVKSTGNAILDLAKAEGVQEVRFDGGDGGGMISNVGSAALVVANQPKMSNGFDFSGSTAEALSLTFSKVGGPDYNASVYINAGGGEVNSATSYAIVADDARVQINHIDAGAKVETVTVQATGNNVIRLANADALSVKTLTVTGSGSVDFSGTLFSTSLTKFTGSTGNDSIAFGEVPAAGAVIDGGEGRDTFGITVSGYAALAGTAQEDRPTIKNFEVLKITDALDGATIDVRSVLTGITGVVLGGGSTSDDGKAVKATVKGLSANSTVEIQGPQTSSSTTLHLQLNDDTSTNDTLNVVLNTKFDQWSQGRDLYTFTALGIAGTENLKITSTATMNGSAYNDTPDTFANVVALSDAASLKTLMITGDKDFSYTDSEQSGPLTTIDASALTGRASITIASEETSLPSITLKGSATAENFLVLDRDAADVIIGGAKSDFIKGGGGADTLTGGGGHDTFEYFGAEDSIEAAPDVITDFQANTKLGSAATGAVTLAGRDGDVLSFNALGGAISVFNVVDRDAAMLAFATMKTTGSNNEFGAALTSDGTLYVSNDDGNSITAVIKLELNGVPVTTLTAAAFDLTIVG